MHGCAQLDVDNVSSCTSPLRICGFRFPAVCQQWHVVLTWLRGASQTVFKHAWVLPIPSNQGSRDWQVQETAVRRHRFEQFALIIVHHDAKRHVLQLLGKLRVPICFSGPSFGRWELCRALGLGCNLPDGTQLCSCFGAGIVVCLRREAKTEVQQLTCAHSDFCRYATPGRCVMHWARHSSFAPQWHSTSICKQSALYLHHDEVCSLRRVETKKRNTSRYQHVTIINCWQMLKLKVLVSVCWMLLCMIPQIALTQMARHWWNLASNVSTLSLLVVGQQCGERCNRFKNHILSLIPHHKSPATLWSPRGRAEVTTDCPPFRLGNCIS